MSGKALSTFLAFVVVSGFAVAARGDVTGSFGLDIALTPEGAQTEAVKLVIDLQSNLNVNLTLSGVTMGADLGFGTTGVEFAVLSLNVTLGAMDIFDQFVFATPFYTSGGGGGANLHPTQNAAGEVNGPAFVKKRVTMTLNIAGFAVTNLAIFEDVDFPNPNSYTNLKYYVGETDSAVDDGTGGVNQTPTFGFGDVIEISGETISGVSVSSITALCASSSSNVIKKRSWAWSVNKACTATIGSLLREDDAIEGGAKTPLLFEQEILQIGGVELGGITLNLTTRFKPLVPVSTVLSASFGLLDLAKIVVTLSSTNITALDLDSITVLITSGNLSVSLTDSAADLTVDFTNLSLRIVLNPNQNPANLTIALAVGKAGITSASFTLGINRGILGFSTSTRFTGTGTLDWSSTTFTFDVDSDPLTFSANFQYTPTGMATTVLQLGVVF